MRHLTIMALLCLCTCVCNAQSLLNVYSKTGAVISFVLSEKPVISYSGDRLILTTQKTEVEYPLSDIDRLTVSDTESKVESFSAKEVDGDMTIYVFEMSGRLVRTIRPGKDGSAPSLLPDDLGEGVYVVKQGSVSYKIRK